MSRPSVRPQIVAAAMDQFHLRGFNGCGVRDITEAAGVPKGSLYNHFDSKEALAIEVMRRYEADCAMEPLTDGSKEPLVRLRAFFETLSESLERHGYSRGCLFGSLGSEMAPHSHAISEQVEQGLARWSASVAAPLHAARASGTLPASTDPDRLGRFIVDAWQGAVIRAKVTQCRAPLDDFFSTVFDSLLPVADGPEVVVA